MLPSAAPSPASAPQSPLASVPTQSCPAELARRGVPHQLTSEPHAGVETPLKLAGPVRGVRFIMVGNSAPGSDSVHDVLDCRLALALDDFAAALAPRGISEVRHMSMYRPGAHIRASGKPSKHAAGLAIDVGELRGADGRRYNVLADWQGALGAAVCPGSSADATPAAQLLSAVTCEIIERQLFQTVLTPNYNRAHANHLHLDLSPGKDRVYVR